MRSVVVGAANADGGESSAGVETQVQQPQGIGILLVIVIAVLVVIVVVRRRKSGPVSKDTVQMNQMENPFGESAKVASVVANPMYVPNDSTADVGDQEVGVSAAVSIGADGDTTVPEAHSESAPFEAANTENGVADAFNDIEDTQYVDVEDTQCVDVEDARCADEDDSVTYTAISSNGEPADVTRSEASVYVSTEVNSEFDGFDVDWELDC